MKIEDALKWLKKQIGYIDTANIVKSDEKTILVPVARDGSVFNARLKTAKGFRIGPKGDEFLVETLEEALSAFKKMPSPHWRRPSRTSGIPGIVTGVRWEERPVSEVYCNS